MRVNAEQKSVDIESRDINYILPAYVRSYLFYNKNEMPEKITFPMFPSVKYGNVEIPIEYVSPLDPVAVEIAKDGEEVTEVTSEQEAALDEKDDRIKELKEEVLTPAPEDLIRQNEETIQQLEDETADAKLEVDTDKPEEVSAARAAFAAEEHIKEVAPYAKSASEYVKDREPKQPPGGDIGPGSGPSDMHPRDSRDQIRTAKDLMEEPDINEAEEKDYEKPISRDEEGKPVVEEKDE